MISKCEWHDYARYLQVSGMKIYCERRCKRRNDTERDTPCLPVEGACGPREAGTRQRDVEDVNAQNWESLANLLSLQ